MNYQLFEGFKGSFSVHVICRGVLEYASTVVCIKRPPHLNPLSTGERDRVRGFFFRSKQ